MISVGTNRRQDSGEIFPRRAFRYGTAVAVSLGILAAYELARAASITSRLGNEDTSLIWVAARDWMAGRIRQPNFYGQSYGDTLEAIPIGLIHALGASFGVATAVTLAGIAWIGWAALAWAALRHGRTVIAALAFATPVVLAAYHSVYVTIELQAPAPRLFVILGTALLIAMPMRPLALAGAALLLGVGLQFDAASALLALPVAAWYSLSWLRTSRQLFAIAAGAVVPVALFAATHAFYGRHPDYAFHHSPSLRPSAHTLAESVHHVRDFFALYAPELWRSWLLPVVALAVLVALLLVTGRLRYGLPGVLAGLSVLYAMSTSRARAEASLGPLLPRGRILLALPAMMWFLTFLVAESGIVDGVRARIGTRQAVAAICVVCIASTAVRAIDFGPREGSWYRRSITLARAGAYGFVPNAAVERHCDEDVAAARMYGSGLLVYGDPHAAYSCATRAPSGVATLLAGFERRTWVLYSELRHVRSRMVIVDPPQHLCLLAGLRGACMLTDRYAVLTFDRQPAVPLLAAIGFAFRGFGPRCHPSAIFSSCANGRSADLVRRPFAPGPDDPEAARAAIVAAYETMFHVASNGRTVASVERGDQLGDMTRLLVATSSPEATPVVLDETFLDDHEAVVMFRIGSKTLRGEAVVQGGKWRVAFPAFCDTAATLAGATVLSRLAIEHECYTKVVG